MRSRRPTSTSIPAPTTTCSARSRPSSRSTPPAGTPGSPDSVSLDFSITFSDVNEAQSISAPTGAKPLADLLGQFGIDPSQLGGALRGGVGSLPQSGGTTAPPTSTPLRPISSACRPPRERMHSSSATSSCSRAPCHRTRLRADPPYPPPSCLVRRAGRTCSSRSSRSRSCSRRRARPTACLRGLGARGDPDRGDDGARDRGARRPLGPGIGGLLNVTFGNAPELIIALFALGAGLHEVVKASLIGSIIGNILLVIGAAMFVGGLGPREQTFRRTGAQRAVLDAVPRRGGAGHAGDLPAGRGRWAAAAPATSGSTSAPPSSTSRSRWRSS